MSEATIRAAIKTTLEGVPGIGVVHDRMRDVRTLASFLELITTPAGAVNGWMFSRNSVPVARYQTLGDPGTYSYRLLGLYEFDDANGSEYIFQALVDAIIDALQSNPTLSDTCMAIDEIIVEDIDKQEFANSLQYHYAAISWLVHIIP